MASDEQLYGFVAKDVRRIHELLRSFEAGELHPRPRYRRPPPPWDQLGPVYRAITVDSITHGTFGTCKLVKWDSTHSDYIWLRDSQNNIREVEAGGYSLNSGQTISAGTAVFVCEMPDGTWEVIGGNCTARDWELYGE